MFFSKIQQRTSPRINKKEITYIEINLQLFYILLKLSTF